MTLLGFQIGSSSTNTAEPSTMDMSLDDLIRTRRQEAKKTAAPTAVTKAVSNADRSIATSRARRDAAMAARRGMASSNKPTPMQMDQAINDQAAKTLLRKQRQQQNKKPATTNNQTGAAPAGTAPAHTNNRAKNKNSNNLNLTPQEKNDKRRQQRELKRAVDAAKKQQTVKKAIAAAPLARPPSNKAIKAAVNAMEGAGFKIPDGMQMVISFAPSLGATTTPTPALNDQKTPAKNNNNTVPATAAPKNRRRGGRGRGGGGQPQQQQQA